MKSIKAIYRTIRFIWFHPLTRDQRVNALLRWFNWQLSSRLTPYPILFTWLQDSKVILDRGMTGMSGNLYCGLHEFYDMALTLHFLRPNDVFLDVGANVGSYTVLAGTTGAECISIEPVPTTFNKLLLNIKINSFSENVDVKQVAVGATEGYVYFSTDMDTTNQVVEDDYPGNSMRIKQVTLDKITASRQSDITMCKVDVEGYERNVLNGAESLLSNSSLRIVLLEADDVAIDEVMKKNGFYRVVYDPYSRRFLQPTDNGSSHQNNHMWVRELEFVQGRCESADNINILGQSF